MLISKPYNNNSNTSNMNHLKLQQQQQQQQQQSKSPVKRSSLSLPTTIPPKDIPLALTVNGTTPSGKPRLYVCNTCTRAFARQEHLKRHERSHTQEKPFVCGVCERLFSRRDLLLRHAQKLHAGCADAITRIRKKSSRRRKSSTVSSTSMSRNASTVSSINIKNEDEDDDDYINHENPFGNMKIEMHSLQGGYPDIPSNIMTNPTSSVSPPTPTYNNLQKDRSQHNSLHHLQPQQQQQQQADEDNNVKRRASFSAVSSANYAMPIPNTSYAESVEFSTPSLNSMQPSWLNGFELDAIPELSLFNSNTFGENNNSNNTANKGDHTFNQNQESPFGTTEQHPDEEQKQQHQQQQQQLPNISGYSFYENEQVPVVESLFNNHHVFKTLLLQNINRKNSTNDEYYSPEDDQKSLRRASSSVLSLENNIDRNLNEIEEITDLNIPKMYDMPAGYSFYGNVDQQSNSASSNATISPSLLDPSHMGNNNNKSNMSTPPQRIVIQTANTFSSMLNLEKYSRILLFSPILRSHINHTLNNYPFVGVKVPNLPSNEKLNIYTENFIDRFLSHYPFVHKSMLNEYALMKTTLDDVNKNQTSNLMNQIELDNLRASISCLPLLVATIGALLSDEKEDANSLYEVSRRCIHVYLDSRKKKSSEQQHHHSTTTTTTTAGLNNNNASPLWLIQSLTLSVIYGLFADNEVSINVVIRQVNALTALVKSSEMTKIKWDYNSISNGERIIDENYYYDFIKYESAVRTIHSIFHVIVALTSLYNIAPSLKIDDLELDMPNSSILWNSSNYGEFKSFYNGFAFQPENFKKCLNDLISLDVHSKTNELNHSGGFFFNHHVSDFGLICLQNGLHQLFYYDKLYGNGKNSGGGSFKNGENFTSPKSSTMNRGGVDSMKENYLNVSKVWNLMVNQCKLYLLSNDLVIDSKLMNYHLLLKNSAFKTRDVSNLKLHKLKEQVWLKDWDKMCEIFKGVEFGSSHNNTNITPEDEFEIFQMISYCLLILKEIFFPDSESELNDTDDIEKFFNNYEENLSIEVDSFIKKLDSNQCDLQHLMKISSLQFQILFDVFLVMIKFVMNFHLNKDMLQSSFASFKNNSPSNEDVMDIDSPIGVDENSILKKRYLKSYISTIKMILSLEHLMLDISQFNQVNNDTYKQRVNNLMLLSDGIMTGSNKDDDKNTNINDNNNDKINNNNNNNNNTNNDFDDDDKNNNNNKSNNNAELMDDDDEIFTGLPNSSRPTIESMNYLIPREKILNKFFKTIDFIFDYLICNKLKLKFGCFKNLNCGLIKLNFFLFNDELITNDESNNNNNMFNGLH